MKYQIASPNSIRGDLSIKDNDVSH